MSAGLTRIGMRLLPGIEGVIERRVLLGVRVWPEITARFIPKPLFPKIVKGWNIAGVCLIRLGHMRPVGMPGGWDRLPRTQPTGSPSNGWKAGGAGGGGGNPLAGLMGGLMGPMMGGQTPQQNPRPGGHRRSVSPARSDMSAPDGIDDLINKMNLQPDKIQDLDAISLMSGGTDRNSTDRGITLNL